MDDKIKVLIPEEEVDAKIKEIGAMISKDYEGKEVHLICVLKGGVFFTCELAKRISVPVSLDFMSVSSYGAGTQSSGIVKNAVKDLDEPPGRKACADRRGYHRFRKNAELSCRDFDAARTGGHHSSVQLLDGPSRRVKKEVVVDYTCFSIPDEFVVGFGLDYDQKYRNLPYIGAVVTAEIRRPGVAETEQQWNWLLFCHAGGGVSRVYLAVPGRFPAGDRILAGSGDDCGERTDRFGGDHPQ